MDALIDQAFDQNTPKEELSKEVQQAVQDVITALDNGSRQVVSRTPGGEWVVDAAAKKAILLYFKIQEMELIGSAPFNFYDKIPLKKWTGSEGVRVVPQALVRKGAYVAPGAILMPSYVNIGARVGSGTMVDTWATVGSCAYVGERVHLSGGVGLGGVLEPIQAQPVVIEDDVFVGSRCIVVEGVHVEQGAVLGAGVVLTQSTRIIDVTGGQPKELKGRVPKNSVVIPGTQTKEFPAGTYGTPCALIIGQRSESTDKKTSLTAALRDFDVAT